MFEKGNTHGKGRPLGARNKFSESFVVALHDDFKEHGVNAIETLRLEDVASYVRCCVAMVPKDFQISGPDGEPLFQGVTVERVKAQDTDS